MRTLYLLVICLLISCKPEETKVSAVAKPEKTIDHDTSSLEVYDYEGLKPFLTTETDKVYVVNFWATWCAPCVKELPHFEELNANYTDQNVEVLLVTLDFPKKYDSHVMPFIEKHGLKSKVIALNDMDSNTWIPEINPDWSGAIPATLIFNKEKRQFYEQTFTYEELETALKQFL